MYQGHHKDGKSEGYGVSTWPDGHKYEGQWLNDLMNGEGVFHFADGRLYQGHYKDGRKEGYGVQTWPNGQKYEGQWLN